MMNESKCDLSCKEENKIDPKGQIYQAKKI